MSTTTLRIRKPLGARMDASQLLPTVCAARSVEQLQAMRLAAGNESFALGELCEISRDSDPVQDAPRAGPAGTADTAGNQDSAAAQDETRNAAPATVAAPPTLVIEGDASRFDYLGKDMAEGVLRIEGDAGDYLAHRMRGGTVHVRGSAGVFACCEMAGGEVEIGGNVGDFAAAALPGDMDGMRGGTLLVRGNAGARLADRMRRGTLLVCGNAGDFPASRLVAGTVCIAGSVGAQPAYGMRRGTLILLQAPARLAPTLLEAGGGFGVFWAMLTRSLARYADTPFATLAGNAAQLPRRFTGDLAVEGRGEILLVN